MRDQAISIIIVTYNSEQVIGDCLKALLQPASQHLDVIVVDNASSDYTLDIIARDYPSVRVIRNSINVGFAIAVNAGARLATGSHIALVNPDAVISEASLLRLLRIQDEYDKPSVIAPLISQPDGRLRIVSAGRFPTPWRMFSHYFGLSRAVPTPAFEGHYLLPHRILPLQSTDWVTGAVLMMTKANWEALGGLSERWFMYAEDIDLCWRAKAKGMAVLLSSEVSATHLVGGSSSEPKSRKADWVVNLYDFYGSSMSGSAVGKVIWKGVVCTGLWSRSLAYWLKAKREPAVEARRAWSEESSRFFTFAVQLLKS